MTKPKRVTLKKYPKRPKASQSIEIWEKYEDKRKDIDKENAAKTKAYDKDVKAFEKEKKDKAALIKKLK